MFSNDEDASSSGCSIDELSESEYEDDSASDYTAFSGKYMAEITNLLSTYSHVNCENALSLNKEMQQRLREVRKRLQILLHAVKQRYISNEHRLKLNLGKKKRGIGMRGAYLKGGTFFFKGNMFFKDINCRNCPNNQDYEYRKNVEGEIFPMDFELSGRHVWSLQDKKALVQAVKEQVIDHLADRKSRVIKKSKDVPLQIQVHTDKLSSLLSKVDDKFQIDWEEVSAHNLKHRHSPSSCKTMWLVYLHPSLKRSAWTVEENKQLLLAAQRHNYQNWESISEAIPKRSDYQCFIQYQTSVCYNDTKRWGRWDKRNDAKLLELVQKKTANGIVDWNAIAAYFPNKSKKSLHVRYMYYLDPKISHEPFTSEEDLILLAAVEEYGEKIKMIPRTLFPNRSVAQLRMRYKYTLKNRHTMAPWSVEDDKKLMKYVAENGAQSWLGCAELLGNHNRISCRTRFQTIKKFFEKNPNTTIEEIPRKKTCSLRHSVVTPQNWIEKVSELRENPATVLVPMNKKERKKAQIKYKKQMAMEEKAKALQLLVPKCKIKTEEVKTKKRTAPYTERLRAVEQKLYHYFKYAYNFRLGTDVCTKPPNATLCEVACTLDFQADPSKQYNHDSMCSSSYISRRCKHYLQRETQLTTGNADKQFGFSLPPSWSTTLAFRALCVQSAQVQSEAADATENDKNNDAQQPYKINNHEAVQRFRNRMFALFYHTALLSRLDPERYSDLIKNTSSIQKTDTIELEELTQDTTMSAYEQQDNFDLSRVKNEYPSQFSSNHENSMFDEVIPKIEIPKKKPIKSEVLKKKSRTPKQVQKIEIPKKAKKPIKSEVLEKKSRTTKQVPKKENVTKDEISQKKKNAKKALKIKRKLKNSATPVATQITTLSATISSCTENNSQTTNSSIENVGWMMGNQIAALQQPFVNTNAFIKQENTHSYATSTQSQPVADNITVQDNFIPQAQQKKKARKSKLLIDNFSSEAEPAQKRVCIEAELNQANIKTEFEI